ncbi:MAG: methyltransferase domain-containing protein [Acidimicrobiales bacterium]|nr:methyltransferase domain-containing protein [Acidimicrobiales bacterium]
MASSEPGVDYEQQGARYQRTRGRTTGTADYEAPVRHELAGAPDGPLLDLGSGTRVWSPHLAAWSGRAVLAVEPAAGMRAVTLAPAATWTEGDDPRRAAGMPAGGDGRGRLVTPGGPVLQVGGRGGALPLRDDAAGAAWLSTVIHHVGDLDVCARELRRVLAAGAPILIRNAFPGRYDGLAITRFFPGSRRAIERMPSVEAVRDAFGRAGFAFAGIGRVDEPPIDLRVWRDQLTDQRRADTALIHLTDDEFAAGLRALDEAIAGGAAATPVGLDLLVLR